MPIHWIIKQAVVVAWLSVDSGIGLGTTNRHGATPIQILRLSAQPRLRRPTLPSLFSAPRTLPPPLATVSTGPGTSFPAETSKPLSANCEGTYILGGDI
ncbi:hypothetical protein I3760_15G053200 [Carya illinoinensis]|nr:hypothetical protein I3760_15G053200 [Carya illinoinensis]